MRRIIERVVTVVTTTTWTITWQDETAQASGDLQPAPVADDLSQPQLSPHSQRSDQKEMIESAKEVDPSETEK